MNFYGKNQGGEFYYLTKYAKQPHTVYDYSDQDKEIFFVFGRETNGLPKEVIENNKERALRVPMTENVRALNLSNTAAILVYEALRQQNYRHLEKGGPSLEEKVR